MAALRKRIAAAWGALKGAEPRAGAYTGGAGSRLTQDWIFAATRSADQEVHGDLRVLKNRARDLSRNNPHAHRFKRLLSYNVAGPHGIRLQAKVRNAKGELDRRTNGEIEGAWSRWCKAKNCTADGRLSFAQVQRLYMETLAVDGEVLLRMLPGFANEFGFAVQVLDTDLLDHEYNRPAGSATNEIRMGVEIDKWGRPVAYHIWDRHPNESLARDRQRLVIPADQIVHDFISDRAGQTRGVTWYASVLLRAKMLDGYEEAVVVGARAGATNMGFFKPNENAAHVDPNDGGEIPFEAEPGTFKTLPMGYDFEKYDPSQPTTSFNEFDKAMLRSIAVGLEASYHSLTGDLTDVNYSSIRQGKVDERDVWQVLQQRLVENLLERLYPEWLKWADTLGALSLPARNMARRENVVWRSRGWDWVDPLKDIQAASLAIALGVTSRTRICAERGVEFEDVIEELAEEKRLAESYGIDLMTELEVKGASRSGNPDDRPDAEALFPVPVARMNGNGAHALNGNGKG